MTPHEQDAYWMQRALELARRGIGLASPNPTVGCVVVGPAGQMIGEGWHEYDLFDHAEVVALKQASTQPADRLHGGTAYVTLEPCNHTGRTGPCAQALVEAGIARVHYAVPDPNPQATGGAETLRAAGVPATRGPLSAEAEEGNAAWLTSVRRGRPHVTWKYAATLDGRVAAKDGSSRWITSGEARFDVHRLRAESDAVVVGTGTLRHDDPHLAVRGFPDATQPLRVALDTGAAAVRPGARILDDAAPTLIAVAEDAGGPDAEALERLAASRDGVEVVRLPRADRGLSVPALLDALYARDVRAVLLEGGPLLAGAFVAAGAVDRVVGYLAPVLLGAGPTALADAGISTLADALRLRMTESVRIGTDLRITAVPHTAAESAATAQKER